MGRVALACRPLCLAALLGGGCAAPEASPQDASTPARRVGLVAPDGPLGLASDGLAVRELAVLEDDAGMSAALATFSTPLLGEDEQAQLARNGLRVRSVPLEAMPSFVEALGGLASDIEGWYGQVHAWQAARSVPVPEGGSVLAVDGRVRRIVGGRLDLKVRGWTTRMEEGPRFQLELVPEHVRGARSRLATVLHADAPDGERFDAGRLDLMLDTGHACIVTYLPPALVLAKPEAGVDPDSSRGTSSAEPPAPDSPPAGSVSIGPTVREIGPDAVAPVTLGELLFREKREAATTDGGSVDPVRLLGPDGRPLDLPADATRQGRRRVLIFVPRIPAHHFPEPLA